MSTPHNGAENGAFAKTVLMPGDPLRAKFIAEKYISVGQYTTYLQKFNVNDTPPLPVHPNERCCLVPVIN